MLFVLANCSRNLSTTYSVLSWGKLLDLELVSLFSHTVFLVAFLCMLFAILLDGIAGCL